ncbi:hypothetical protein [Nonomuraea sp. NPDC049607]|uniref:hypothetical protein n=1 Tax=Nonomuraea sp. NPDC049607 TaxID=3154732 RepID=UPI00342EA7C7
MDSKDRAPTRGWGRFLHFLGRHWWQGIAAVIAGVALIAQLVSCSTEAPDKSPQPNVVNGNCNVKGADSFIVCNNNSAATPAARLEVTELSVGIRKAVRSTWTEEEVRKEYGEETVGYGPVLDVTIKNSGGLATLASRISVTFSQAFHLEPCVPVGGPLGVSANYDIAIPEPPPATPFVVTKDVAYEFPSNKYERFTLTIGPKLIADGGTPLIFVADVELIQDGGSKLKVGRVAVVDTGGHPYFYPDGGKWVIERVDDDEARRCMGRNRQKVREVVEEDGLVLSAELSSLATSLAQFA